MDCEHSLSQLRGRMDGERKQQCLSTCIKWNNKVLKCADHEHLDGNDRDYECPFNDNIRTTGLQGKASGGCHDRRPCYIS